MTVTDEVEGAAPTESPPPIDANPTKEFFIDMLTKDIPLKSAIVDLVDNCLDGARRLRENEQYDGLYAEIEVGPDKFKIHDNCLGFSVERAKKYALRFGRVEDPERVSGTIGQFGVGMKRALFKLGSSFAIESKTSESMFRMEFTIDSWKGEPHWGFRFLNESVRLSTPLDQTGTAIEVTDLHPGVKEDFELPNFAAELVQEISSREGISILKGFRISVNGLKAEAEPKTLLRSIDLRPIVVKYVLNSQEA